MSSDICRCGRLPGAKCIRTRLTTLPYDIGPVRGRARASEADQRHHGLRVPARLLMRDLGRCPVVPRGPCAAARSGIHPRHVSPPVCLRLSVRGFALLLVRLFAACVFVCSPTVRWRMHGRWLRRVLAATQAKWGVPRTLPSSDSQLVEELPVVLTAIVELALGAPPRVVRASCARPARAWVCMHLFGHSCPFNARVFVCLCVRV
jgi:hypothetical protein